MISYFEYKILKEAEEPGNKPGDTPPSDLSGLPAPPSTLPGPTGPSPDISGMGGSPGMPDLGGGGGMPDLGMGGPTPTQSTKPLELKFSNVWDAFEKLIKLSKK